MRIEALTCTSYYFSERLCHISNSREEEVGDGKPVSEHVRTQVAYSIIDTEGVEWSFPSSTFVTETDTPSDGDSVSFKKLDVVHESDEVSGVCEKSPSAIGNEEWTKVTRASRQSSLRIIVSENFNI